MTRAGEKFYADQPTALLRSLLAHPDFRRGFRHVGAVIVVLLMLS